MNREIKFRAWEKELKQMIPVHSIDFESEIINKESAWRDFLEIELMQFTGLKDVNGKEIYEGDVVRCTAYLNENIEFENETVIVSYSEWFFYPFGFNAGWRSWVEDIEVIGNVFENPSLLK